MGCDVLVLVIAILSIKIFKISYLHKYWCFLSILKCKSYLLVALEKLRSRLFKALTELWVCCGFSNRLWCFGPCYCHIVNKNFQNIKSPQVLMLFEHFKMPKLSTCCAKEAWRDSRKHWTEFWVCCGCSNGLWCFGPCYCHIVNESFQNIKSPQVLMYSWAILKCKSYLLAVLDEALERL